MKMLYLVKTIVFLMSALLVAGFAFLFVKIAEKQSQSKLKSEPVITMQKSDITLSETENVVSMTSCGEFVCLLTHGNKKGDRLLIIQPKTGDILNSLWLKQNTSTHQP